MFIKNPHMDKLIANFVIILLFSFSVQGGLVTAQETPQLASCDIIQLTDNDYVDVLVSPPSEGNVVWYRKFSDYNNQIFFWDGNTTTQISNNYNNFQAQVSGNNVVWEGATNNFSSSLEIFFWNGDDNTITRLTDNSFSDLRPDISGNNVVWYGNRAFGSGTSEIFFWNGDDNTITQVTDNSYTDYLPQISGNNVVWVTLDDNRRRDKIFFWDGVSTTLLSDDTVTVYSLPEISGNNVVWEGMGSNDYASEIFFWDGDNHTTRQLTDNNFSDRRPHISGNNVVWMGYENQIFFWDGDNNITRRLSYNNYINLFPQVSGNNVVWAGRNTHDFASQEIFFWDGSRTIQITDNSYRDWAPKIDGNNIVWMGYANGLSVGDDLEVFFVDTTTCTTNTPPTANANDPYEVNEGGNILLSGIGTDAQDVSTALAYRWDLDGDGTFEAIGKDVWFSAATLDGSSTLFVSLEVCDTGAACDVDTAEILIANVAPIATLTRLSDRPLFQGESIPLTVTNVFDPSVADTNFGFFYSLDCHGDGTFEVDLMTSPLFDCTYPDAGTYHAVAQVTDKDSGASQASVTIEVLAFDEAATSIIEAIYELETNLVLNSGQANSLIRKLENLQASVDGGNITAAHNQINAFINEVESLIDEGVLPEDEGFTLIDLALRLQYSLTVTN